MQQAFQILSFPDLSLPKYFDLFGEEALNVVSTRLFTWMQIATSARQKFSFTLRYIYDPQATPSNRRLRVYVILSSENAAALKSPSIGRRLTQEVFAISETKIDEAIPPHSDMDNLCLLIRRETLLVDRSSFVYLPAIWGQQSRSRDALEPYLDESFAALQTHAFLDIQLHSCDPFQARQTLRATGEQVERMKDSLQSPFSNSASHLSQLAESVADDPSCHLLIIAGSRQMEAADAIIRSFGINAIGGSRCKIVGVPPGSLGHEAIKSAVTTGCYEFQDNDGWFSPLFRKQLSEQQQFSQSQLETAKRLSELAVLAGPALTQEVLTLPIPSRGFLRTFPLETELERTSSALTLESKPSVIRIGTSLEREEVLELPIKDLTRHAFIAGVTGSGKTVTMFNILNQLAQQGIPFIVFEPAKAEYRRLTSFQTLDTHLRIYTPGRDNLSPIRLNPFAFDASIPLVSHIGSLAAAFNCALGLFPPVNAILEEALWQLYESKGWKEDDNGSGKLPLPRVDEIPGKVCKIIDSLGYDPEITGRFKGVIQSRFIRFSRGSVGRLFDCDSPLPNIADLCSGQCLIELKALSQQESNLLILFVLMAIREYLSECKGEQLRLVMVIEEAHNLAPAVSEDSAGNDESNAKAEGSRYISNMLAEMRALGLGILVVDQTPAAVAHQVLRNTNLKIAHRTVAKQDRESLADAMLMAPAQTELLGRLSPGQAYIYADRFFRSYLVQGAFPQGKLASTKDFTGALSDQELLERLVRMPWFKASFSERVRTFGKTVGIVANQIAALSDEITEDFQALRGVPDKGDWLEKKRELKEGWRENLRKIDLRLKSLESEARAINAIAKTVRLKAVSSEKLGVARKMFQMISDAVVKVEVSVFNAVD